MRGKRSKQYRKLMQQYGLHFGFREPYQVLVDAAILQDAARFKMDFVGGISKALHGQIKPMITQCCIRHLYDSEPKDSIITEHAKGFERRRCNHHELDEPLSALECLTSVVDPKRTKNNKHRYVVACQDEKLRAYLRTVPGVPLLYLKRSVLIMEPMAGVTEEVRERDEKAKFRAGLKGKRITGQDAKRKDDDDESGYARAATGEELNNPGINATTGLPLSSEPSPPKKKRKRGPSGPNPLSMKKPKKLPNSSDPNKAQMTSLSREKTHDDTINEGAATNASIDPTAGDPRPKRRRRHKTGQENDHNTQALQDAAVF